MFQPQFNPNKPKPRLNEDDIRLLIRRKVIETVEEVLDERRALNEMATIGSPCKGLVIMIRTNDGGNIPHFHIMDEATLGWQFETCIRFDSNKYFHHHGKEGVLNSKQRKQLMQFLSEDIGHGWTNWNYMVDFWNRNNSEMKLDPNIEMPDYSFIEDG